MAISGSNSDCARTAASTRRRRHHQWSRLRTPPATSSARTPDQRPRESLTCTRNTGAPAMPDPWSASPLPPFQHSQLATQVQAPRTHPRQVSWGGFAAARPRRRLSPLGRASGAITPARRGGSTRVTTRRSAGAGISIWSPASITSVGGGVQMVPTAPASPRSLPAERPWVAGSCSTHGRLGFPACAQRNGARPLIQCIQEFDFNGSAADLRSIHWMTDSRGNGIVNLPGSPSRLTADPVQLNGSSSADADCVGRSMSPPVTCRSTASTLPSSSIRVIAFRFDVLGLRGAPSTSRTTRTSSSSCRSRPGRIGVPTQGSNVRSKAVGTEVGCRRACRTPMMRT